MRAEIMHRIDADPTWSGRLTDPSVRADLAAATGAAVSRFVDVVGTAQATFSAAERARFRNLGAGEAREGRGLEDLLAAYRIGTRVLYAQFAQALAELDPSPTAQVALGEAVFALIDSLQVESAAGYAQEVTTHTGERERRLHRLADALLAGDEATVRTVAAQVGWPVPAQVAVLLVRSEVLPAARSIVAGPGFGFERDGMGVLVVAGDHEVGELARRIATLGGTVRIGPIVPLLQARRSLAAAGLLTETTAGGPLWAADVLPDLLVRNSPELAATLAELRLAPLDGLRESQRVRLTATLSAWLRHWGQRVPISAELDVHPQTVGYRLGQLRDLFGDDLDDPDRRLELQLALLATPRPRER